MLNIKIILCQLFQCVFLYSGIRFTPEAGAAEITGMRFRIIPAHIDENYLDGESPRQHVKRLSHDKATVIAEKYPEAWVLGADTIVVIDGFILGKPENKKQALEMLRKLSGREHKVLTGFTIVNAVAKIYKTKVVQSAVKFKKSAPKK